MPGYFCMQVSTVFVSQSTVCFLYYGAATAPHHAAATTPPRRRHRRAQAPPRAAHPWHTSDALDDCFASMGRHRCVRRVRNQPCVVASNRLQRRQKVVHEFRLSAATRMAQSVSLNALNGAVRQQEHQRGVPRPQGRPPVGPRRQRAQQERQPNSIARMVSHAVHSGA